jgi:hypothetical protein
VALLLAFVSIALSKVGEGTGVASIVGAGLGVGSVSSAALLRVE